MSTTPILDREQPVPAKSKLKKWWIWLVASALGAALAISNVDYGLGEVFPGQSLLIYFLPAFYFSVLIHELGHAAGGLSAGFELRDLNVGAFFLHRETRGWKLRVVPRRAIAGGLVRMVPKSADNLMARYVPLTVGGPAATLATLIVTLGFMRIFPDNAGLHVLLFINLMLGITASLPYALRGQPSDAKQLLVLLRKGPAAERLAALLYVLTLDAQQVAPRDWPPGLVEKVGAPVQDKVYRIGAISVRYADALDRGDPEQIAQALEIGLAASHETTPEVRRAFFASASCFHSIFRNNVTLADTWLESARRVKNAVSRKDWDAKALASIALAKGDRDQARQLFTRYIQLLDRHPASGLIAAERVRTLELLGRADRAPA